MKLNNIQSSFFTAIKDKRNLEDTLKKHQDFLYDEAQWHYTEETIEMIKNEIRKIESDVHNLKLTIEVMKSENNWSRADLKEMKKLYTDWSN